MFLFPSGWQIRTGEGSRRKNRPNVTISAVPDPVRYLHKKYGNIYINAITTPGLSTTRHKGRIAIDVHFAVCINRLAMILGVKICGWTKPFIVA